MLSIRDQWALAYRAARSEQSAIDDKHRFLGVMTGTIRRRRSASTLEQLAHAVVDDRMAHGYPHMRGYVWGCEIRQYQFWRKRLADRAGLPF